MLFGGSSVTGATLEDFSQYDQGRKFPLAKLQNSKINWASENGSRSSIDSSRSLIAAITGDTIEIEEKHKQGYNFEPEATFLFNINDILNVKASVNFSKGRFAILSYTKTYKKNADPEKGEIEEDPRFRYDPDYLVEKVLPSLLNRLIQAFQRVLAEGIDYACCDAALQEVQVHNSHLFEFSLEIGLSQDSSSILPIGSLWEALESYYRNCGVLTVNPDGSRVWEDGIRPGDLWIKGANQLIHRLTALFPKIKKVRSKPTNPPIDCLIPQN